MSATLAQSAAAAFPDRGQTGLKLTLNVGNDGSYLNHDLGQAQPVLHVRFALAPQTASGGAVRIAGGQNDAGDPRWWIDYHTDTREIHVTLHDQAVLTATLHALPWHIVELELDTLADKATLWLNGLPVDNATGTFTDLAIQHAWIGALFKDTALTGELFIDEWIIATAPVGPVTVAPSSAFADDPARWLVVYNAAHPDSVAWADAYRTARHVPLANLLGLELPDDETIAGPSYIDLVTTINDYLARIGLDAQVMGVLVGHRVPGYVDLHDDGTLDPVPAMLHSSDTTGGFRVNPNAHNTLPTRPTFDALQGDRLTARIDAPDLNSALALIERATTSMDTGLGDSSNAILWFDPLAGASDDPHALAMIEWVQSIDRMRLRLPLKLSGDIEDPQTAAQFEAIDHDAFLWMWDISLPAVPPPGFFADPPGKRIACVQLHLVEPVATTVRTPSPTNWIEQALDAGYAAAAATSRTYSGSAVPYARPFFEAMRRGWTIAEAWYLSLPLLREGLYLVGDPLLRTAFPQRGWDVFGPLDRLEAFDPDAPALALREQEISAALPATLQPDQGRAGVYVVRRLDGHGRAEASATAVRAIMQAGAAVHPPLPPAWPDHLHWPVRIEDGKLAVTVLWDRPLSACRIKQLELRGEVDGGAEITLAEPAFDPRRSDVSIELPLPEQQGRYRWRLVSPDDVALTTPWSRFVRPREPSALALHVLKIHPST